ncbi:MAG: 6-bladed beta-propeller [Gemmatimonadetes bacterium]|nr:6-bladed beta-propeller [Gemmatimonadota bacterium]
MRRIVHGIAALAFVGCGDGRPPAAPAAEVTDSAGVTIVTSMPTGAVYAELGAEPSLSIGALEGPEEILFDGIVSIVRDGAGNLIVADNGAGEIRVFDAAGSHLRSFGSRGDGPGEFQALVGAWLLADGNIVAADRRLQRISRFDRRGTLLGTGTLAGVEGMDMVTPVGPAGPATFLSQVRSLTMPGISESPLESLEEAFGGDEAPPEYFVRYRLDGAPIDTVARHPGQQMSVSAVGSGTNMSLNLLRVPFSPEPAAHGSDRGVVVTAGTRYEVGVFDDTGALIRIVRLAEPPTPRTDEHLEAYVRNSGNPFAQDEAAIRSMIANYREMPLPETLPAYTDLRNADSGELWARRYHLRGAPAFRWDVFGADGRYLGRVEIPSSFAVEEIGLGQVVGVSRDEFGVERVEVRELILSGR